ncbi:MAG: anthranilate synthase component I family protein [Candidatus Baldrarchaeia archaeon]
MLPLRTTIWEEARKIPLSHAPDPYHLVAWAEEQTCHVALLEGYCGLSGWSRYTIVAYGKKHKVEEENPFKAYKALEKITSANYKSVPCPDMVFGVVGYEAVVSVEPWLGSMLKRHRWPVVIAFKPEVLVVYDKLLGNVIIYPEDTDLGKKDINGWRPAQGPIYETPKETFEEWVKEALTLLDKGEFLQIVLSRVEQYEYQGEPLALYKRLAQKSPSPYMFYMRFDDRWILGSSPELLVKMENGRLETCPIAGTRPRGVTPEEDLALEEELLRDEKEIAEHLMLVDLARNDLGRVARPGTVKVLKFMDVEKYSGVQHIVSRIEADAHLGVTYIDVLASMNPAGTVSGAPKPRAMEVIAKLEDEPRGPYAGAVGMYSKYAGETAITIRSLWNIDDSTIEVRAGAGIVYDSKPYREYLEIKYKLNAIYQALGINVEKIF